MDLTAAPDRLPQGDRWTVLVAFASALLLYLFLPRRWIGFDGLALLDAAGRPDHLDLAHPLYPPLLRTMLALGEPLGVGALSAGAMLSALGGAVAVAALAAALRALGARPGTALAAACLFGTAPEVWLHATTVEVYVPALAGLALALALLARAPRTPRRRDRLPALGAALVAAAFHVASLLAPLAGLLAARARRRTLLGALGATALAAALGLGVAPFLSAAAARFAARVRGFLPDVEALGDLPPLIAGHAHRAGRYFVENEPWVAGAGALGLAALVLLRRPRALSRDASCDRAGTSPRSDALPATLAPAARPLALERAALPYLVAYLLLGVPALGLLLPVVLVLACVAGEGASRADLRWPRARPGTLALLLLLAAQVAATLPDRWREAMAPDPKRVAAERIAAALPEDAFIVAGELSWHLRRFAGRDVLSVPELVQEARGRVLPAGDLIAFFKERVKARARGRPAFITTSGSRRLFEAVRPAYPDDTAAHAALLPLVEDPAQPVIADRSADLRLYRLRAGP